MKIVCTRENLSNALSIISGAASKNINLPILNNVLIRAENQKVELIATNLELAITTQLRAKVEDAGSFTLPAKTLNDFVNLLSDEKVEIERSENHLKVVCGKSSTKIKGVSAEEFPILPTTKEGAGYLLDSELFKKGIEQVVQSAAKNDIRPELAGVSFIFDIKESKQLIMAATDSYRLAEKKIQLQQGDAELSVIVPARTVQEISRVLALSKNLLTPEKTTRLILSDNQIIMRHGDVELMSRLVEGKYPDYTQIIPKEFNTTAQLSTQKVVKAVKAAGLFSTIGVNAASFELNEKEGYVGVSSASAQAGEHKSELSAQISGVDISILLNHRYVLEGLNNMDSETCELKVVNSDSPCVLSPVGDDSYLYIVMPIRQ
ncbi:MAG: DNA polymerase III subunit beta [bacterium]